MKSTHKQQIIEALNQYLTKHQMNGADFSKKSGINEGYISTLRNFKFEIKTAHGITPIADRYFHKIAEVIDFSLQKSYWDTKVTDQMKQMLAVLEDAKTYGYTNVIIGETGSGKTYVANLFAKAHPMDVHIITVGSNDRIGDLMDKVLEKINVPQAKTKSKKIQAIVKYFQAQKLDGKKSAILFDECEYMKQPTLCTMKEFNDHLFGICAVVLIGTDQLVDNLKRLKRLNKAGIPQLYRRIKFGIRTLPAIDRSYKLFLSDIKDRNLQRFFKQECDNYGELNQAVVSVLREAERMGEQPSEQLARLVLNIPKSII